MGETITYQGQSFTRTMEQGVRMLVPHISGEADAWLAVDSVPIPERDENPNLQAMLRLTEDGRPVRTFSAL